MRFTIISTFNLIPLATGTTGQNGRKTQRLYRHVRLVVSCPSFLALKYRKFSHFVFYIWVTRQSLRLIMLVVMC